MKTNFVNGTSYLFKIQRTSVKQGSELMLEIYDYTQQKFIANGTSHSYPSNTAYVVITRQSVSPYYLTIIYMDDMENTLGSNNYNSIQIWGIYVHYEWNYEQDNPNDDGYIYYRENSYQASLQIDLYQLACEKHKVGKTTTGSPADLTFVNRIYGTPRDDVSLTNPSIIIEWDYYLGFNFNYVYISKWNRWYFVNSVDIIRKNVYRMNLHVDVLNSYATDIKNQTAFISRNENSMDGYIIDDRLPLEDLPTINYKSIIDTTSSQTNASFSFSDVTDGYKFALHVQNNLTWIYTPSDIQSYDTGLPDIPNLGYQIGTIYLMDDSAMANVYTANMNNDNGASYIISMLYLPIDLHSLYGFTQPPSTKIYAGKYVLDTDGGVMSWYTTPHSSGSEPVGYNIQNSNSPYLIIQDFVFDAEPYGSVMVSDYGLWINNNSKTHYELYLPFVGYVELSYKDLYNSRIQIMYSINFDSGMGLCIVYNKSQSKIIYSTQCQIGYQIPINTSNAHEITIQKQNNTTNLMLSLVSSVVSIGLGGMAGGIAGAGSAILGATKGINAVANYINHNNLLFERAVVNFGGEDGLFYLPVTKPHWKVTYHEILYVSDYDNYLHLNGHPLNKTTSLSSYTGYTEIPELHYKPSSQKWITSDEIDEIVSLAKTGIIL